MSIGTYLSGVGHAGLLVWLLAGWGLRSEPLSFDVSEVSVVSGEEYAALVAATSPNPNMEEPAAPALPELDDAPPPPMTDEAPAAPAAPEAVPPPADEAPPPPPPPAPEPPAPMADQAPEMQAQPLETTPPIPDLPPSERPQPRPADRVAPTPVAPPPPDAQVAETVQESAEAEAELEAEVVEEALDETAPEETTTEIVIEDAVPSSAVETSLRPQVRPSRPTPAPTPEPTPEEPTETATAPETPEPEAPETPAPAVPQDDVAAALAAAGAGETQQSPAAANEGPPMTGSERDAFRLSVQRCWVVDPGSEAARVTVTVAFELNREGRVQGDIRSVGSSEGSDTAVRAAFDAARRAILRCQADGFPLPGDKFEQWRDVEMTFNPNDMRVR